MGCEAKTEFQISTMENKENFILYALEDTSCINRFICSNYRSWVMNVSSGAAAGGPLIGKYERPLRCPMDGGKCSFLPDLCFQEVKSYDPNGAPNGSVKESCYVCVPTFNVKAPDGTVEYRVLPPTCLGGMCVNICAEGLCNCRIPFYVFPPTGGTTKEEKIGFITKIWAGMTSEVFTDAAKFEVQFPNGSSTDQKARLLGGVFLLNQLFFEKSN